MNLAEAFALYGAEGARRAARLSAIARDGAIILGCSSRRFCRPAAGVLRYEDILSGETGTAEARKTLREHLQLARTGSLPIRLIVITETKPIAGPASRTVHVRQDLVGSVVDLDDDHYVVDFVRATKEGTPDAKKT
jgi:hypothetical protein